MHRTMLRVNYFNYDNAGKYLRLYNHDMLHTDIHDVGNCTSLTVPIKKLQEAIADVSTIKQERRTCRLICYLSILDRCVLQKISFLKNLWEKSPLDGIQNLIRDMIHSRRDGKTDRSVVTNDGLPRTFLHCWIDSQSRSIKLILAIITHLSIRHWQKMAGATKYCERLNVSRCLYFSRFEFATLNPP